MHCHLEVIVLQQGVKQEEKMIFDAIQDLFYSKLYCDMPRGWGLQ